MIKICGNCKSYYFTNPNNEGKCLNIGASSIHRGRSFSPLADACTLFRCKKR